MALLRRTWIRAEATEGAHDLRERMKCSDREKWAVADVELAGRWLRHPGRDPQLVSTFRLHDQNLGRTRESPQHASAPPGARVEAVVDADFQIIGVLEPRLLRSSAASSVI